MSEIDIPARRPGGMGLAFARMLTGGPRGPLSGTLLVTGDPGGAFHLHRGAIVEVTSPGAPGVETLLLRSGRVSEADWAAVLHSRTAEDGVGAELVARELVGTAELQLICVMAALDGALAMGMGRIDGFTLDHGAPVGHLAAPQAIEPEWLVQEAERRIRALGSLGMSVSPFCDRLVRTDAGTALLSGAVTGERREILLRADGRRSSRDIAFLLGRSLYAVTVEASRMLGEGLIQAVVEVEREFGAGYEDEPRAGFIADLLPAGEGSADPAAVPARPTGAPRLPHRRPGASGINDVLPLRPVAGHWRPPSSLIAKYRALGGHLREASAERPAWPGG